MELAQYLYAQITSGRLDEEEGRGYLGQVLPREIAVVGMSCEYTGAPTLFDLERLLRSGRHGFAPFPESRRKYFPRDHRYLVDAARSYERDPEELFLQMCGQPGSYLEDVDQFEPGFFDIPEHEATYVDPMHRLVLKHLHLALEHSGLTRAEVYGSRTAVYVGKDRSIAGSYASEIEADSDLINPGTWEGILASRLNYLYDLQGGSLVVDTACSSSLVALHIATKMLRDGEIDLALVGGIALGLAPRQGEVFGDYASVETSRDHLKVFDQASSGTIFGEGVGFVVLRRLPEALERGEHVYSVVRATGINSDGRSNGLTAPNPKAQTALVLDTYAAASITPDTIDYVDAHGTGTKLGDPIEIRGLTDAFRGAGATGYSTTALSSLKENIGHTVGAAGVGGLIKMSLALDSRLIYPACGFEVPNDFIKFIDTPFYVPDALSPWERGDHPRRGAISSFGFSGTNGHTVLEEFEAPDRGPHDGRELPFLLSAPTPHQLVGVIDGFLRGAALVAERHLPDVAFTLARRRARYATTVGFTAGDHDGLLAGLRAAREALVTGTPVAGVVVGTAADAAADGAGSRALDLLRSRMAAMPDLLTLTERLGLTVTEGADLLSDGDLADGRTCGLPGHVFDTKAYWGTVKTYNVYETEPELPGTPLDGPLLDTKVLSTPTVDLYSIRLDPSRWFLADHRIAGHPTLSGTAYTQVAAELATLHFGTPAYELSRMMFKNLIQVPQGRTVLVEAARRDGDVLDVQVFSPAQDEASPVVAHGSFTLRRLDPATLDPGKGVATASAAADRLAWQGEDGGTSGMRFAGRWDLRLATMLHETLEDGDHLLDFTLHPEHRQDLADFHLSPAILDLVAGVTSWERSSTTGQAFLPLSYGRLRFTGRPFTARVTSRTTLRYDTTSEPRVAAADVWVYDEDGELVVQLERYAMRAFTGAPAEPSLHEVGLTALEWPATTPEPPASVLLVGSGPDADTAWAGLDDGGRARVRRVTPEELETGTDRADAVVWVIPSGAADDPAGLAAAAQEYLGVAKAAPRRLGTGGRLLVLAARGLADPAEPGDGGVDPFGHAALAAARVVQMENPRVTTLAVSDADLDLARALNLARSPGLEGRKVRVDGDRLRGEVLRPRSGDLPARTVTPGSTVLLTGGFGGIGLEYLDALWREHQAHAVVLGRRDLDALAASDHADDRERAARARALVADGMELRFVPCDLDRPAEVREAVAKLRADSVRVSGVVHLAGVPEDGMLFRKEPADLAAVLAPKAGAASALLSALGDEVDWVLAASSMTTLTGAPGQFGYTLANAVLEGLARSGSGTVSTVRWPGWKETGMALRFGVADAADDAFLLAPLTTAAGAEYVRRSLAGSFTDLVVGDLTAAAPALLDPWLERAGAAPAEAAAPAAPAGPSTDTGGMTIKDYASLTVTGTDRELDDLEKLVTVLFASVLDADAIDVTVSFTDLGGDSLKAFSIYTPLVDRLGVDLEVADIFIHSTVLELSAHVRELQED
ncbi:beta-ketoacyl synthase N-terminal-like domain-containing protein [Phycicoccus flavus]|uniref:KR domain-containing protein n=1 Tax=Phycicoccus flavus TaxID=2502783 RepID=A0A8T6R2I8_9MICO|nr:beta-ketoacyl synthase N-terminal-like domain-containing protein [Phycicoccus flavus]NHA67700.1 KR domain-containing protein [Phycicoccus flavus]